MDEQELTPEEFSMACHGSVLSNRPQNVQSGRQPVSSHYNVFTLGRTAGGVAFCKQAMKPETDGHLFCSALQFY